MRLEKFHGVLSRREVGYHSRCAHQRDTPLFFIELTRTHHSVDSSTKAFKLLREFRPSSRCELYGFDSDRAIVLLKAMQITAGFTLGLMAWDKRDRSSAATQYVDSLKIASTHAPFMQSPIDETTIHLERWIALEVHALRKNLSSLFDNDTINAGLVGEVADGRRRVISVRNTRIEAFGHVEICDKIMTATDSCRSCKKRGRDMLCCSACKIAICESFWGYTVLSSLNRSYKTAT